jgi:DNA helicase-2/ATP-dependent DNA helicase PcrA
MRIKAKFSSRCPECGKQIEVGDWVEWVKGGKATHTECAKSGDVKPGFTPAVRGSIYEKVSPSKYQQDVIDEVRSGKGDIAVIARAGSGKTTLLELIVHNIHTPSIRLCAFSKMIEQELQKRLFGLANIKTTYAAGRAAIASAWPGVDLDVQNSKYYGLAENAAKAIVQQVSIGHKLAETPGEQEIMFGIKDLVNFAQLNLISATDLDGLAMLIDKYDINTPPLPLAEIATYVGTIMEQGIEQARRGQGISYSDMVWLPYVCKMPCEQFEYTLVDEAADLNAAQLDLVLKMRAPGGRIIFVYDPCQCVFGFAGSDDESVLQIVAQTGAKEMPLPICYRCDADIVALARQIVPDIQAREGAPKGLISSIQYQDLADFLKRDGTDAILCRKTAPLVKLCFELIARKIPARVRGREIGTDMIRIIRQVAEMPGFLYERFQSSLDDWFDIQYVKLSQKKGAEKKQDALQDKVTAISTCWLTWTECTDVEHLIRNLEWMFTDQNAAVTLSTGHRSKGLQWKRVFVLEPECLPLIWKGQQAWEYKAEKWLEYVVYTRAENELYFIVTPGTAYPVPTIYPPQAIIVETPKAPEPQPQRFTVNPFDTRLHDEPIPQNEVPAKAEPKPVPAKWIDDGLPF